MKDLIPTLVSTFVTLMLSSFIIISYSYYRSSKLQLNLSKTIVDSAPELTHIPNAYTSDDPSINRHPPHLPEVQLQIKRPCSEMLQEYFNATKYGVWIDDIRIDNADLIHYTPTDFDYYMVSTLESNSGHFGLYKHHVTLLTPKGFKNLKSRLRLKVSGDKSL